MKDVRIEDDAFKHIVLYIQHSILNWKKQFCFDWLQSKNCEGVPGTKIRASKLRRWNRSDMMRRCNRGKPAAQEWRSLWMPNRMPGMSLNRRKLKPSRRLI
jgi:hypothetical protein